MLLVVAAAGFVAYGPPGNYDAHGAVTERFFERSDADGLPSHQRAVSSSAKFPADVILERCERRQNWLIRLPSGAETRLGGYECIIEIWPNAEPSYRTSGFFHHDGFEWAYYGPVSISDVPSIAEFSADKTDGRFISKPGSITYNGDPNNPVNKPGYNPYMDQLESLGWSVGSDPDARPGGARRGIRY